VFADGQIQVDSAKQTTVKRCPAPTPVFTGRQDKMEQVEGCIISEKDERRICVVHGLGGAGKTQVVLKVIERTRQSWSTVLYVDASSRNAIEGALQTFAVANNLGKTHDDTIRWLESCREQWLLVFDNADIPSLNIRDFFPSGDHGSIVITTRLNDMVQYAKGPGSDSNISTMNPEEAQSLLMKMARKTDQDLSSREGEVATALLEVRLYCIVRGLQ
jgi:hypothetical protein